MMVGYFRADFKGANNHGETPSSCNDEWAGECGNQSGKAWLRVLKIVIPLLTGNVGGLFYESGQ